MNIVGIIAEYNPFHNGHLYQIQEAIDRTKADYCIVCMSGNFVQRGEAAVADKYTRCSWALQSGADLVLELPTVYALSPAQSFASSGVRILSDTGVVTHLSFGAETDDLSALSLLSDVSELETDSFKEKIAKELESGKSYPRAYFDALVHEYGESGAQIARTPNNILAIEYLKAIKRYAPSITPVPVLRIGSSYDDIALKADYSSAASIRAALKEENAFAFSSVPSCVSDYFSEHYTFPSDDKLASMIMYALRTSSKEKLSSLPEVTEGIENRFYDAVRHNSTLTDVLSAVKSKRYTMAKVKRIALQCLLNINSDIHNQDDYIKVLGFKKSARALLAAVSENASVPLLIQWHDIEQCSANIRKMTAIDALSSDFYEYLVGRPVRKDHSGAIII